MTETEKPNIIEVVGALLAFIEAKRLYDKAYEAFEGYSWDYAGHDVIAELKTTQNSLTTLLEGYIRYVVADTKGLSC